MAGCVVVVAAGGLICKLIHKKKVRGALEGVSIKIPIRLVDKEVISTDSYLYTFALPNSDHVLGLPIGNCVRLHARIDGANLVRPYTPISTEDKKGYVQFIIKTYRKNVHPQFPLGGKMTQHLESLTNDQYVDMSGPCGNILYKGDGVFEVKGSNARQISAKYLTLICGGSGITPMYQLIQHILNSDTDMVKIALLYANRKEDDILMKDKLEKLRDDNADQFRLWYTVESPPIYWSYSVGYVDKKMLEEHVYPSGEETLALLCGPKSMIDNACVPNLMSIGYSSDHCLIY